VCGVCGVGGVGGVGVCGVCGVWGVGGVGVWAHSLRSTFHRLHLLRLWTPTILFINLSEMETFMIGFSLYSNTAKLLNTDPPKGGQHLSCLEGIRFLSMTWVVLGHAFSALIDFQVPNSNLLKLTQVKVPNNSQPKLINETNLVIGL
jgi:hypothetical protein